MVKKLRQYQLLIFLFLTLIFRLGYASTMVNFTQDQARDVVLMQKFKDSGTIFVGYGPKASVGNFYLAPLYYQLHYWLSLFTNNHPLTMHYFTAVVESLTPLILLLILKKFVRPSIAYVSALLYVVSPLTTIFGTFAWNPNMIPFLSTLSFWLFLEYWEKQRLWQLLMAVLAVAAAVHFHYQAVVLVPFVFLMMAFTLKRAGAWKHWLITILVGLATLLPYFWSEINANWHNTKEIFTFFTSEHARYFDRVSKPEFVLTFIPQFMERIFFKESFGWLKVSIGRLVFIIGLGLLAFKALRHSKYRWPLLYFALILVMLRVYKGDKLDYYMSTLFIMPYFLLALLMEFKRVLVLVAVAVAWFAGGQYALLKPTNQLAQLEEAVVFLKQAATEKEVKFIFHDDNYLNIFAYGLNRFTSIKPNREKLTVVDVCYGLQNCDWDGNSWCAHDRGFTYTALFREQTNYKEIARYVTNDAYNVRLGKVDYLPQINYQISLYDSQYGTDLIEGNW